MEGKLTSASDFATLAHRIFGIHTRLFVAAPEDVKRLRRDLADVLTEGRGSAGFTHFVSMGAALARSKIGLTMREISLVLDVPQSTATRIVDSMVNKHHFKRVADSSDRRIVRIAFTDSGRKSFIAANELLQLRISRFMTAFNEKERAQLLTLLHRLADVMEQETLTSTPMTTTTKPSRKKEKR